MNYLYLHLCVSMYSGVWSLYSWELTVVSELTGVLGTGLGPLQKPSLQALPEHFNYLL